MNKFKVRKYDPDRPEAWEALVASSNEGTLFHRLAFLAYHGDRFAAAEHPVGFYKGSQLIGVMPLGLFETEAGLEARSPYGGSYGGPALAFCPGFAESRDLVAALLEYLGSLGAARIRLTLPLAACYREYSDTFRLALHSAGFEPVLRELSSIVFLDPDRSIDSIITSRARNMIRKAERAGTELDLAAGLDDFWTTLEATFAKHAARPTHSRQELAWLKSRLPESVRLAAASLDGRPVAGAATFVINERVANSFYLCQDPAFQDRQALSLLIRAVLEQARDAGARWYDFGPSSFNMVAREPIFRFKESFGAVGQFRETYQWRAG